MNRRWWWSFGAATAVGFAVLAKLSPSHAFDHQDSPGTIANPPADIADVFAFMQPEPVGGPYTPTNRLVLVMTFNPGATAATKPTPNVVYKFDVRSVDPTTLTYNDGPGFKVECSFQDATPPKVLCNANGVITIATVGDLDAGAPSDDVRVFAGLRSDPAFADVAAVRDTIATGQSKFQNPGTNAFQGKNVMALVVELNLTNVLFMGDAGAIPANPMYAVTGQTIQN